ncbi:hypothetical protein [Polaribacter sp. IC073]|uniref:hypothetical protein n=1 Tax=Polaribacter sp. IC073 TaxID=2508540 RepID=UPI001CB9C03A|nr:hypothetical protein [Polaribacter sp. IC073]
MGNNKGRQRKLLKILFGINNKKKNAKELQRLKDEELSKFESLFLTATRWHKSQYIRNYIQEFEAFIIKSNNLNTKEKEWIDWAKEKADWYDPFIEKK